MMNRKGQKDQPRTEIKNSKTQENKHEKTLVRPEKTSAKPNRSTKRTPPPPCVVSWSLYTILLNEIEEICNSHPIKRIYVAFLCCTQASQERPNHVKIRAFIHLSTRQKEETIRLLTTTLGRGRMSLPPPAFLHRYPGRSRTPRQPCTRKSRARCCPSIASPLKTRIAMILR